MSNDFVRKVYKRLNPTIEQWCEFHKDKDNIYEHINTVNSCDDGYHWGVRIECCNGYRILLHVYTNKIGNYKFVKELTVQIEGPTVESVHDNGGGNIIPLTRRGWRNLDAICFTEGEFDISDQGWVNDIYVFMDRWVLKEQADVEAL